MVIPNKPFIRYGMQYWYCTPRRITRRACMYRNSIQRISLKPRYDKEFLVSHKSVFAVSLTFRTNARTCGDSNRATYGTFSFSYNESCNVLGLNYRKHTFRIIHSLNADLSCFGAKLRIVFYRSVYTDRKHAEGCRHRVYIWRKVHMYTVHLHTAHFTHGRVQSPGLHRATTREDRSPRAAVTTREPV